MMQTMSDKVGPGLQYVYMIHDAAMFDMVEMLYVQPTLFLCYFAEFTTTTTT